MDGIAALFILFFVTAPLLTLIHELGHALAGLSIGAGQVTIQLGALAATQKVIWHLDLGRIRITLARWTPFFVGFARMNDPPEITSRQKVWFYLSGPLTSLIVLIVLSMPAFVIRNDASQFANSVLQYSAGFACIELMMTASPMRYPKWMGAYAGKHSDMACAIRVFRNR